MIRKYHNHKSQTSPWHPEEEPLNHHEKSVGQIKQINSLSLPHQDDCNTRMGIKQTYNKTKNNYRLPQGSFFWIGKHVKMCQVFKKYTD